jgi:autotransporter-associated beta strand protein
VVTGAGSLGVLSNAVTGGLGGWGGRSAQGWAGGDGGSGGIGLYLTANATLQIASSVTGGSAGFAGVSDTGGYTAARGGNGGVGLYLAAGGTVTNTGSIKGGFGGQGGQQDDGPRGGDGGIGVYFAAGGTLINAGVIEGGWGGFAGAGGTPESDALVGDGGEGIVGSNLSIVNSGSISRGLSSNRNPEVAIRFTGGVNSLTITASSSIEGDVIAASRADTFGLGGTTNASFDLSQLGGQYRGFGILQKSDSSTWTLSGAADTAMAYQVLAGTLDLGATSQTVASLLLTGGVLRNGTITSAGPFDLQSGTVSAVLAGTSGLAKTTAGTVVLSGANTYTGATTVSAGTLRAGAGNTFSSGSAVTVSSGATLDLNGFDQTIGSLGGAGSVTLGSGQLTAGGDNTNTLFSGTVSGTGVLEKAGTGTMVLTGVSAASTMISAGTLQIGNGGTSGEVVGDVANAGVLAFNRSDVVNFTGAIGGTGSVRHLGSGTTILSSVSSYLGGTTVEAGAINVQNDSALGTGAVSVTGGAALEIQGSGLHVTNALTLNGAGVADGGALRNVSGGNFYDGTITLGSASRINSDVGSTLTVNAITGAGTTLSLGGLGTVVTGAINTGTGGLIKDGTGTAYLAGANTYTGTTTVNDGLLVLQGGSAIADTGAVVVNGGGILHVQASETIGSLAGAGTVNVTGGRLLSTGVDNTSTTFSGAINELAGPIELFKLGAGTFTLAGTSTYTGATNVDGGTLSVNGSIAASSLTVVNAGATLGGNGTVGNTTINGGTLAPGNSIGLLTVQGNLVFTSASRYMVEVSPADADRVNVTGTATLGGATVNASFAPGTYVSRQYTIVNAAGGVVGTFGAQVNTNLPSNFKSSLGYDARNAYLNLTLDYTPPGTPETPGTPGTPGTPPPPLVPLTGNQTNVGNALVGFFNRTGGIPLVFGALNAEGLSQVSGELGSGAQQTTFDAVNQFMGVMTDPFMAGRSIDPNSAAIPYNGEALAYAGRGRPSDALAAITRKAPPLAPVFQASWNVWAAGFGGSGSTDGNAAAGSNKTTSSIYGTAVGADYWFSPATVAGFSLAGGGTNFSVDGGGAGRSDLFQAGAFVRHGVGSAYVIAAAAYGWQDITTDRNVTVAGLDRLHAEFSANTWSGRIEAGNRFVLPWVGGLGLTPYVAGQATVFDLPSYAETATAGTTTFALAYSGRTITATRSELGLRSDKSFAVDDAIFTLRGRAAWAHDFNSDRNVTATFQALPGASFVVNGAAQARNAALTTVSAEMKWINGWSVAASFEGEFSEVTQSYAGKGVVRYAW